MRLLRLLILLLIAHFGVFVSFPDTGNWGISFCAVSLVLWTLLLVAVYSLLSPLFILSKWLGRLFELATVLLMLLSLAMLLPQESGDSPLAQLIDKKYPTRETFQRGLSRLGLSKKRRRKMGEAAYEKIQKEFP